MRVCSSLYFQIRLLINSQSPNKSFYQNNKVFKKGPYVYGKDEALFDKCPHLFQIIPTASFSHIQ